MVPSTQFYVTGDYEELEPDALGSRRTDMRN